MAKDPLAQWEILIEPSNEADYEAIYASVAATQRGREFLAAFARRIRHADMQMIVEALARIEAGVRGEPPAQGAAALPSADLRDIAAALGRIEVEISSPAAPAPEAAAAIERLQDIAFVLHERAVEATLCDGLDGAVREIAKASARSNEAAERVGEVRDLIRALRLRINDLIEGESRQDDAAEIEAMIDRVPAAPVPLFQMGTDQVEGFAQAVAEVVASLPARDAAPAAQTRAQVTVEPQGADAPVAGEVSANEPAARQASPNQTVPSDEEQIPFSRTEATPRRPPLIEELLPQMEFESGGPAAPGHGGSHVRSALHDQDPLFAGDDFARPPVAADRARPRSQLLPPLTVAEDDPADLFESSATAASPLPGAPNAAGNPAPDRAPPVQSAPAVPPQRAVPRPAGNDPLAAVRALSDEELIALFS